MKSHAGHGCAFLLWMTKIGLEGLLTASPKLLRTGRDFRGVIGSTPVPHFVLIVIGNIELYDPVCAMRDNISHPLFLLTRTLPSPVCKMTNKPVNTSRCHQHCGKYSQQCESNHSCDDHQNAIQGM